MAQPQKQGPQRCLTSEDDTPEGGLLMTIVGQIHMKCFTYLLHSSPRDFLVNTTILNYLWKQ